MNDLKATLTKVNGELEMEHKAKVEAKLVLEMSIVKAKQMLVTDRSS